VPSQRQGAAGAKEAQLRARRLLPGLLLQLLVSCGPEQGQQVVACGAVAARHAGAQKGNRCLRQAHAIEPGAKAGG
jgi:hypothetical protein